MSRQLSAGCLIAFAAPFAVAGLAVALMAGRAAMHHESRQQIVLLICFSVAFMTAGFGLIAATLSGAKGVAVDDALRAQNPSAPWMWRAEWASRRIPDRSERSAVTLWVYALMWNAVSAPIFIFAPRELARGNHLALMAYLFPIIGIGFVVAAVRASAEVIRFGPSLFLIDTLPVPMAGSLRGRIVVSGATDVLNTASSIVVRLTCYSRTRDSRNTWETILCRNESQITGSALQRTGQGIAIPIDIEVPSEGQTTDTSHPYKQTLWRLNVDAGVPGVDYNATFDVPVFGTATDAQRSATARPVSARPALTVVERQTANGLEIDFPPFRARGAAFGFLFFTAIWIGVIDFMIHILAPFFFLIVFGSFGLLFVWITLDLFFGASVVRIAPDGINVHRSLLLFRSDRRISRDAIDDVRLTIGMQTTGGSGEPYYEIDIALKDGTSVTAGKYLRSKPEAEWIASEIRAVAQRP